MTNPSVSETASDRTPAKFGHLPRTSPFREAPARFAAWLLSSLTVIGAGMLGQRITTEAVRAGARVHLVDPDVVTDPFKLGRRFGETGQFKAVAVKAAADAIRPGYVAPWVTDARHHGVGAYASTGLILDASDDPTLAVFLTTVSNGIGVPLIRVAVDGSGTRECGRVLISHGSFPAACQVCSWSARHLLRTPPRTPCPNRPAEIPPTIATGATAAVLAGVGLLQAMRLAVDPASFVNREIIVDLDNFGIHEFRLPRSDRCISGHRRWSWENVDLRARELTVGDALDLLARRCGTAVPLEAFNHPLWTAARCGGCGAGHRAVGSSWATPPVCRFCGEQAGWAPGSDRRALDLAQATRLGVRDSTLLELGLPERGAMLVGRADAALPVRLVLD